MRLLHVQTCQLRLFIDPASRPRYAILSHVWQAHEWSYKDVDRLREYHDPRARISDKIRSFCILAEREGFEWIWIDTCCINQTSSAELSEAINSMYLWYAQAVVCYAYLHDVSTDGSPAAQEDRFAQSVWFTRGWTLQELLAPSHLIFLSCDWKLLGTKEQWAAVIQGRFNIDRAALTHTRELHDFSIAARMSWAARRHTSRPEDRAYSLMGLFDIHMPPIYGEGLPKAFYRLQVEILKQSPPDQSLFAWGFLDRSEAPMRHALSYTESTSFNSEGNRPHDVDTILRTALRDLSTPVEGSLLAPTPDSFAHACDIEPVSQGTFLRILGLEEIVEPPDVYPTGFAIRITLPLIEHSHLPRNRRLFLAPLQCRRRGDPDSLVYLYIRERPSKHTKSSCVVGRETPQQLGYSRGGVLRPVYRSMNIRQQTIFVLHNLTAIHQRLSTPPRLPPQRSSSTVIRRPSTLPLYTLYIQRVLLEASHLRVTALTPGRPSAVIDGLEVDIFYGEPGAELVLEHFPLAASASYSRPATPIMIRLRIGVGCPCRGIEPLWFTAALRHRLVKGEVAVRPPVQYCPSGPMPYPSTCLQFGPADDFVYRVIFDDWPNRSSLALHAEGGSHFSGASIGTPLKSTRPIPSGSPTECNSESDRDTAVSREDSPMAVD
ncbi:HET-domain-containing protein [Trametes cingulata]|nr:HET-domain-containing protein [Trametes cingulata]